MVVPISHGSASVQERIVPEGTGGGLGDHNKGHEERANY